MHLGEAGFDIDLTILLLLSRVASVLSYGLEVLHVGFFPPQVGEQVGNSTVFLDERLQLQDVLLVELNLPLHVL